MKLPFVHVGYGNYLAVGEIEALVDTDNRVATQLSQAAKRAGRLVRLTGKTSPLCVIVSKTGRVYASPLSPIEIVKRVKGKVRILRKRKGGSMSYAGEETRSGASPRLE